MLQFYDQIGGGCFSMLENFDNYNLFNLCFSGVVPKVCCKHNNIVYIVKSDKPNEYKCLSEYLASKIAKVLDIDCQKVSLGYRNDLLSCGIEVFNNGDSLIHHYYDVNDSSLNSLDCDVRELPYTLEFILEVLRTYNSIDVTSEELISNFVTMCLFDCLIGNYDRHWGNWGFLGAKKDYIICPLFDNGSSLYPKISVDEINSTIYDKKEIYKNVYEFPKSQIRRTKKKKYLYKDLMCELLNLGFREEFKSFIDKFENNIENINAIFNEEILTSVIPKIRLDFLHYMLMLRFKLLIKEVFTCK